MTLNKLKQLEKEDKDKDLMINDELIEIRKRLLLMTDK